MDVTHSLVIALALAACTGGDPAMPLSDAPAVVDAAPVAVDAAPAACAAPLGAGTMHGGSVNAAETWTAAASPHILAYDTGISAALTIEPCAVVRLAAGVTVTINPAGSLIAAGSAGLPVTFEALVPGKAWSSIRDLGGTLSLSHAVVRGGGAPLNTSIAFAGALHMQSSDANGVLHLDDVEIADSLSQGVYVNGPVGFDATSQDVRIHGAAGFPIHVYARVLGSIPTGTYTGNARDAIGIAARAARCSMRRPCTTAACRITSAAAPTAAGSTSTRRSPGASRCSRSSRA